ncbi:recombinase family protein [Cryptosporangium phraense]|uniref:Recombinase family protein n=1 Tax=Cryptosporangium phraense TaxID=2593070 RepID=A0A545AM58_9ACTN|nr:recombinase family protein [Cryptosporangium phraense]TQS42409.1 recombinase family protein [Cryptosporangium phraense]
MNAVDTVTLPAEPTIPIAWPPSVLGAPVDRPAIRLLPAPIENPLPPLGEPELPFGDVSRIVVGYLRAAPTAPNPIAALVHGTDADGDANAPLVDAIARYARERGLRLLRVHRDDVSDDDARRPGFSACLRHLYLREASAIIVPTWGHLAPNDVLRRALCHNATSAGGTIHVVEPMD